VHQRGYALFSPHHTLKIEKSLNIDVRLANVFIVGRSERTAKKEKKARAGKFLSSYREKTTVTRKKERSPGATYRREPGLPYLRGNQ